MILSFLATFVILLRGTGWVSQVGLVMKNPPANARYIRDIDFILGLGRSAGGGHATYSRLLAWRTAWTEEQAGYSPKSCTQLNKTEVTEHTAG